jgi:hypothetical protein
MLPGTVYIKLSLYQAVKPRRGVRDRLPHFLDSLLIDGGKVVSLRVYITSPKIYVRISMAGSTVVRGPGKSKFGSPCQEQI